jgi:hypothetical protein
MIHAEVPPLQMLAELGDHPGKDQILGQRIEPGHVDDLHAPVLKVAPGQVTGEAIIRNQPLGPGADVAEPVAHLSNGGDVMRLPNLATLPQAFHIIEDPAEKVLQIGKGLDCERAGSQGFIQVFAANYPLGKEIDEGVGLGIDVIPVENHLRVVEHLAQPPNQGLGVG